MNRPQTESAIRNVDLDGNAQPRIWLKGDTTNLKPNDPLLIDFGRGADPEFFRVHEVTADAVADRTLVRLAQPAPPAAPETP